MKILLHYSIMLCLFIFYSCGESENSSKLVGKTIRSASPDSSVASKRITTEMAGSAYRKRADCYFVIVNSDTSSFIPFFSEGNESGLVTLDLNLQKIGVFKNYLPELRMILLEASKDYNFNRLKWILVGRLINTGDFAIKITREFIAKYGATKKIYMRDYEKISSILLQSDLVKAFNGLLLNYSLEVEKISIEKAMFVSTPELLKNAKIEPTSTKMPDKILDCIVGINLKQTSPNIK